MKNLNEYGSVYQNKETGEKFKVKKVDCSDVLMIAENGECIKSTRSTLRKFYRFIKKESKQMKYGELRKM